MGVLWPLGSLITLVNSLDRDNDCLLSVVCTRLVTNVAFILLILEIVR